MLLAVQAHAPLPAEEEVNRRLRQSLTTDDPLAVIFELAAAQVGLQHR